MSASMHPFDYLKNLGRHTRVAFVRDIKSEVSALDDGRILVITRLLDEHHDMSVALVVDKDLVIQEIACKMERMPYPVCPEAERAYDGIKGLMVFQRGIIREIRSRVERTEGCTHFTELIEASLRALFAGLYSIRGEKRLADILSYEERRQINLRRPVLADTCRSFRKRDADEVKFDVALDKIRAAGMDPQLLDPHRGI